MHNRFSIFNCFEYLFHKGSASRAQNQIYLQLSYFSSLGMTCEKTGLKGNSFVDLILCLNLTRG
jgi:hypothetical protein